MSAVGQTLSINDEYKRRRAFAANRLVSRPPVRICAKPSLAAGKPRKLQLSYPDIAEYIELREYDMNLRRKSRLLCTESRREKAAPSLQRPRSGRVVSGGRTTPLRTATAETPGAVVPSKSCLLLHWGSPLLGTYAEDDVVARRREGSGAGSGAPASRKSVTVLSLRV